jgi:capsular polysaccharide biosynthesis protein
MDVSDVVHRVALAYWPLIIGLALLGAMAGGALHVNDAPVYTSDVRFVLDAPDPQAAAESTSIADAAKSIATSPSHVSAALALAGVTRDIARYVTQNIELQPLGTSGVLDLQVKDTDRTAAAVIANALAKDIIDTRAKVARDRANALLATLNDEIQATNDQIAKVDAAIASFRPSSDPSVSAATLSGLYSERASLAQERTTLEAEENSITESLAMRPQAGIIDPAVPADRADPSRAPIDIALGVLGGLVVGLMLASLLAVLRPRIKGVHQIEQALDAPVLGDFDPLDEEVDETLGARVRIAANRAGVKKFQMVAVDGSREATALVSILADRLGTPEVPPGVPVPLNGNGQAIVRARRKAHQPAFGVTLFNVADFSKNGVAPETALILVAPDVLHKRDLETAAYLTSLTGWPVAGIVTYSKRALRHGGLGRLRRGDLISLRPDRDIVERITFRAGLK